MRRAKSGEKFANPVAGQHIEHPKSRSTVAEVGQVVAAFGGGADADRCLRADRPWPPPRLCACGIFPEPDHRRRPADGSRRYYGERVRTRLYRNGVLEAEDLPPAEVSEHLRDGDLTVWIDLGSPDEAGLALVADELGLHELAVEDAVDSRQRPKIDEYDSHCYLTAYSVTFDEDTYQLSKAELGVFVTDRAVVTVRPGETFDIDAVVRRWDNLAHLAKNGVDFLVHGLLDHVVDSHLDAAESLDEHIEALEDMVFDERPVDRETQRGILTLRRSLATLRRVVLPMQDVVTTLLRRGTGSALAPYFQDVYDHVLRVAEWTESLRELITTIRETQLNLQSNRLNLIMKKVTGWAAIIAVPTAITGFYGQNVPYPGFGQASGFWTSTVAILVIGGGLYLLFKRRDWL
jgi:magnesium transporter